MTQKVTRGDVRDSVMTTGEVSARTKVNVGSQLSGVVEKVYVDFNSGVKRGQVLAELNTRVIEAQLAQSEASVAAAEANIESARVTLADAERTLKRNTTLATQNLIAQADVDESQLKRDGAAASLKSSEAALKQAEADLKQKSANLSFAKIRSPIDGVVIDRQVEEGQTVAAQLQVATLFVIAADMRFVRVLADIDEADVGKVSEGMPVDFTVDAFTKEHFKGTIHALRQVPTSSSASSGSGSSATAQSAQSSGVVTYAADIEADNPELKLRQGMTAHVNVVLGASTNVVLVPNAALRFVPKEAADSPQGSKAVADAAAAKEPVEAAAPGNNGTPHSGAWATVYLIAKGLPVRADIITGLSNGHVTEVISGLKEDTEVITGEIPQPRSSRVF